MKKTILKKAAAAVLCAAMAASLTACGGGSGSSTGQAGSEAAGGNTQAEAQGGETQAAGGAGEKAEFILTVQNGSEPSSLDPNEAHANDVMDKILHMYEGLAKYRTDGTGVELAQASDYTVSDDGLVYTFTLRDDIFWSDGQPVVAGDFVYSWQRLVSGGYDNSYFIDMV